MLRTALSLSAILGQHFEMKNIRGARERGGLQRQHLASVQAMKQICGADVEGAELHSKELVFEPSEIQAGNFSLNVGTAGSVGLILQCLLPALAFAPEKSHIELIGGTDTHFAPPHLYLENVFLPAVGRMGFNGGLEALKWGWYPQGSGVVNATVEPVDEFRNIELVEKGGLKRLWGVSAISNLPAHIAERQKTTALKLLAEKGMDAKIEVVNAPSVGKGSLLFLCAEFENSIAGFSSLGEIGKPAEKVAENAVVDLLKFIESNAAVDKHLADQLLLYAALARGKTVLQVEEITDHVLKDIEVIELFLPVKFSVEGSKGKQGIISVEGIGFENKFKVMT